MAEIISKDRVPYKIWDKVNGVWNKLNFTTNTRSVDADDGNNLEDKIGAINGVTSDFSCEDESIVASMPAVASKISELNNALSSISDVDIIDTVSVVNDYVSLDIQLYANGTKRFRMYNCKTAMTAGISYNLGTFNSKYNPKQLYQNMRTITDKKAVALIAISGGAISIRPFDNIAVGDYLYVTDTYS